MYLLLSGHLGCQASHCTLALDFIIPFIFYQYLLNFTNVASAPTLLSDDERDLSLFDRLRANQQRVYWLPGIARGLQVSARRVKARVDGGTDSYEEESALCYLITRETCIFYRLRANQRRVDWLPGMVRYVEVCAACGGGGGCGGRRFVRGRERAFAV